MAEGLARFFALAVTLADTSHAEHGIHRGANLMTHVGEKLALYPGQTFRLQTCRHQFAGAGRHQVLQMVAVLIQFLAIAFLFGDVFADRNVMADFSGAICDRSNALVGEINLAIAASVNHLAAPGQTLPERLPHRLEYSARSIS